MVTVKKPLEAHPASLYSLGAHSWAQPQASKVTQPQADQHKVASASCGESIAPGLCACPSPHSSREGILQPGA